ncbi:hypothetical protein GOZ83_20250 [Agrobacterium vitis]|uniref:hypothetical protein n=1 Tax=Rhizobium/Agrobacterium group TaxID=227290 RepID=UPI0012E95B4A|nr:MULTISPECIES: hypothetical protein [Rhizobium/Agrobacterium group]MCF1448816.1 hypothetical protein [Allorhizobium ampelinum]MCF1492335.1 hypothetical protein [Allorhizobium ampelinum]MVA47391.1 hypothetical protein [Agrobacterium vitis]
MLFSVGDIVYFKSDVAGKAKYHFCFCFDAEKDLYSLMFLNSEGEFFDHFAVDCSRIPDLPKSRSGRTVFSCPTVIRRTDGRLRPLKPVSKCKLPHDVAADFLVFAQGLTSMTEKDKTQLIATLCALSGA